MLDGDPEGSVAVERMWVPGGGGPTGDPKLFGFTGLKGSENKQ